MPVDHPGRGWLAIACLVLAAGCGGESGPPRFHISGTVEYNGAPLPYGEIVFEPDSEADNKGPMTRVSIVDGKFSTKTNAKGTVGGPMIVRINGTDGKESGTQKHGGPLFKEHVEKVDLPKEETTQDFDVPAKK